MHRAKGDQRAVQIAFGAHLVNQMTIFFDGRNLQCHAGYERRRVGQIALDEDAKRWRMGSVEVPVSEFGEDLGK